MSTQAWIIIRECEYHLSGDDDSTLVITKTNISFQTSNRIAHTSHWNWFGES